MIESSSMYSYLLSQWPIKTHSMPKSTACSAAISPVNEPILVMLMFWTHVYTQSFLTSMISSMWRMVGAITTSILSSSNERLSRDVSARCWIVSLVPLHFQLPNTIFFHGGFGYEFCGLEFVVGLIWELFWRVWVLVSYVEEWVVEDGL
jgi:hypothetical protein